MAINASPECRKAKKMLKKLIFFAKKPAGSKRRQTLRRINDSGY